MKVESNGSSVFKLNYHLIISTAFRKNVLNNEIIEDINSILIKCAENEKINIINIGQDKNHVHISFSAHPNSDIVKFIQNFKTQTSKLIKNMHPEIKQELWGSKFWSKGYALISVGGVSVDVLQKYIDEQGIHPEDKPNKKIYTRRKDGKNYSSKKSK